MLVEVPMYLMLHPIFVCLTVQFSAITKFYYLHVSKNYRIHVLIGIIGVYYLDVTTSH